MRGIGMKQYLRECNNGGLGFDFSTEPVAVIMKSQRDGVDHLRW